VRYAARSRTRVRRPLQSQAGGGVVPRRERSWLASLQTLPDEPAVLVQRQSLQARSLGMMLACRAEITDDLARHVHQVVAA